ncbi:hypothetical protein [Mesorhizobium huakuii]|uniref:Uncharacterized protein n=1 Tax=Mesorhizobium huakuii TaxID=28104 RepID=A0A7G6T1F4_9HYPH|nr:hypothetical protein [Mesorhizobium huakuii]QND60586.1 hypothetical protein HB778_31735 [Mesorhizobium huakuii]
MAIPFNRYLVTFERHGRVIARESVTAPRESDALVAAARRHADISLNDGTVKVGAIVTGSQKKLPDLKHRKG